MVAEQTDSNTAIFQQYQDKLSSVKNELKGNIDTANNMLAIGWGDFGARPDSDIIFNTSKYKPELDALYKLALLKGDSAHARQTAVSQLYSIHYMKLKIGYVLRQTLHGKKFLGFIILAFAVCLGAPFWFDLLNKLIKLRSSGKKEESTDDDKTQTAASQQQPLTVNVNSAQSGGEAVG
jgi:hypothetical protein